MQELSISIINLIIIVLTAVLTATLTGFASYYASYRANKKINDLQLRENRKGLATTLLNDIRSLYSLYDRVVRQQLSQDIKENQIPLIFLIEPKQNYFAVFDNLISELKIINDPVQQHIIQFYGKAKAQYDQCLEYSRKLEDYSRFKREGGFALFGVHEDHIKQLTENDFQTIVTTNPALAARLGYYKRTDATLFDGLRKSYLYLREEDFQVISMHEDVMQGLEKYRKSLDS